MEKYLSNFKNCLQKEVPFCRAECPFHIDVLEFIEKLRRGSFKAAFKNYKNAVGFPVIVSHLCDAPCMGVCPRQETDDAINLPLLEQACLDFTKNTDPADYNLPKKKGRIAIVGGGISGLACALRLATKKYEVEVFEKSDRIGGHLWDVLDSEIFLADIEHQFMHETYTLHCGSEITDLGELVSRGFDAVYVATGSGGPDFGLLASDSGEPCMMVENAGVFAGGSLLGKSSIYAIADGLNMSTTIDNFLKTGNLIYTKDYRETAMCLEPNHLTPVPAEAPTGEHGHFTKEEAVKEAQRCLECQCDACRVHCDLTEFFNKWPLRIRDEIQATTLPGSAEVKATPAKRLISTCNQCGLCLETCPQDIDLGGLILAARKSMHSQKKAPWPFHDFWMRDMQFSNGEFAALAKAPPQGGDAKYAFFPGCQLGADDPSLVLDTYRWLLSREPASGLILSCCGIPADWSGDADAFAEALQQLRNSWEKLGRPTFALACPTCRRTLHEHLPEIPTVFIYELMADRGFSPEMTGDAGAAGSSRKSSEITAGGSFGDSCCEDGSAAAAAPGCAPETSRKEESSPAQSPAASGGAPIAGADASPCESGAPDFQHTGGKIWSVFDPCSTRGLDRLRSSVRKIAADCGAELSPLVWQEKYSHCCGYGGQISVANPEFADFVVKKRVSEGEHPYLTYCINCRDTFLSEGKEALHILELFFGRTEAKKLPTVSLRRDNRVLLKSQALREFWGEEMKEKQETFAIHLIVSDEMEEKLNKQRILKEEILNVIDFCQRTGRTIYNTQTDTYSGYRQIGNMTFWAEYRVLPEGIELVNAYSHRMKIELEAVWNGHKVDLTVQ